MVSSIERFHCAYIRTYNIRDTCIRMDIHMYVRTYASTSYPHLHYLIYTNTHALHHCDHICKYQGVWFGVEELDEVSSVPLCVLSGIMVPN